MERCSEPIVSGVDESGDTIKFNMRLCDKPAPQYRTCGRGCKHVEAYCAEHGGDARAQQEMRRHHETQHPEAT